MTDITRQSYVRPPSPIERRADALAELRQLHSDFEVLEKRSKDQERFIERLTDRNNLLLDELRTSRQHERVATNKLIRLATAMANIGMLSREAEEIVRSAREWHEDEAREMQEDYQSSATAVVTTDQDHAVSGSS